MLIPRARHARGLAALWFAALFFASACASTGGGAPPTAAPAEVAPAEAAPAEAAPATRPAEPADGAAALLEQAQFALLAHAFSSSLRRGDDAALVGRYVSLVAIELGISAELLARGQTADARALRDHARSRASTLAVAEALGEGWGPLRPMIVDPPGGWILSPSEIADPVRARVDALRERAFADVAPLTAPSASDAEAAVERYATTVDP
jgi:hypothetical protein